jgi:hypothetical protein
MQFCAQKCKEQPGLLWQMFWTLTRRCVMMELVVSDLMIVVWMQGYQCVEAAAGDHSPAQVR